MIRNALGGLAALMLLATPTFAQINGLRVTEDGSLVASATGAAVSGEIAVEHEQTSGTLAVTFVNSNLTDYVPAPGDSLVWSIADPSVATSQGIGSPQPFTMSVNGVEEGMTTITYSLRNNGLIYTAPAIELHVEEEFEVDGLIISDSMGNELVHVWQGLVTGEIEIEHEQTTDSLTIEFLAPDSTKFVPEAMEGFAAVYTVADEGVATVDSLGHFAFQANGIEEGMTTFTIGVFHIDHVDFVSPAIELHVEEEFEADGLIISHQGTEIVTLWQGFLTGSIQVPNGGSTMDLTIEFLEPAASPEVATRFVPEAAENFSMQLSGNNVAVATVDSTGHFVFTVDGQSLGSTSVVVAVAHEGHVDFSSLPVPITVLDPGATDAGSLVAIPKSLELSGAFPNPVRWRTSFQYGIPQDGFAEVVVFDVVGRRVDTLLSGNLEAGTYRVDWDSSRVPAGVYFVKLNAAGEQQSRKVIVRR